MDSIYAENVTFSYEPGRPVLEDVSFRVAKGEWIAIVGHNGSGKSTLAKCLNGLLLPSSGRVVTCGYDTADKETIMTLRRRAGMVFQHPDNQLVAPTVADDVAFGLENAGVPFKEMQKRVGESIKRLRLEGLEEREPHRLSGGQKQRVALAGITALHPEVIILDEATSMLDPAGRKEVRLMMEELCRNEGITIIAITHDVEEAADADRMLVMKEGRLLKDGTPRELFREKELLESAGLALPLPVFLAHGLREQGVEMDGDVMTERELVDALCASKQNV
ncbi:energy-coupling factor transporter ATPase [Alkalicoccus halolimnae]|uniref:Energy-coupling factor transporter ATPase n=1 Tax=Alkalicoccus halolimnae TaxID=1667239 RepID=A0A5C7F4S2_9BACI|nr:energy-coupling factor transporter ATPase [Alkalicoccus halolimnae]TXF83620.1 energy-coupling factor transporter ATPase [Alkalicoccus halolimnae]